MARRRLSTDPFPLDITALNPDGTGAGELAGGRLRVHGALPGEQVQARHLLGRRFRGQAETLEVELAAPCRVEPRCAHFGTCGACALQHMDTRAQLDFKQELLHALLADQGVHTGRWLPPLDGGRWGYRRKARLSVREVRGKQRVLVGFRERNGRFVTDMHECHVLDPRIASQLTALSGLLDSLDARAAIPQIEVACGDDQCVLLFRHLEPLGEADRDRLLAYGAASGLRIWTQSGGPDTAQALPGQDADLRYRLPEWALEFRFEPLDFFQVNPGLNRRMVAQALAELDLRAGDRVLDLFCGLGNFTLPIARQCQAVTGLEGSDELVARARANARANAIDNARFERADLYGANLEHRWPEGAFDRALLDPPRSGAAQVLPLLARSGPERVVYVSCNPATLASDAALLQDSLGYRLAAAGIMDMFPQTPHVEAMAVFERS